MDCLCFETVFSFWIFDGFSLFVFWGSFYFGFWMAFHCLGFKVVFNRLCYNGVKSQIIIWGTRHCLRFRDFSTHSPSPHRNRILVWT